MDNHVPPHGPQPFKTNFDHDDPFVPDQQKSYLSSDWDLTEGTSHILHLEPFLTAVSEPPFLFTLLSPLFILRQIKRLHIPKTLTSILQKYIPYSYSLTPKAPHGHHRPLNRLQHPILAQFTSTNLRITNI